MPKSAKINVVFVKQFAETKPIFDWFGISETDSFPDFSKAKHVVKFAVDHKHYKLTMYDADKHTFFREKSIRKLFGMRRNTVFIFTFSVAKSHSYRNILNSWSIGRTTIDFRHFPIILVGCTDPIAEPLGTSSEPPITFEMGKQLARRINAVKYLECSSYNQTEFENMFEEVVSAWILHSEFKRKTWITDVRSFSIFVFGNSGSGNFDFVRSFVFGNRMNVVGEYMNEQTYFYCITAGEEFDTFIEIDGEEYELVVCARDFTFTLHFSFNLLISAISSSERLSYPPEIPEVYIFTFSVVNPDSFDAITNNEVENITRDSNISARPFFLVGYQADLRNDAEILKTLSTQGKQPITYEMGEELARRINAVQYLECSSCDVTEIAKVFEEATWAILREFEERQNYLKQKKKSKSMQGYLKRLFQR